MNEGDRDLILRVESKVDRLIDRFDTEKQLRIDAAKASKEISDDHELRLRSVERWKLSIPVSVLLAAATIVGGVLAGRG